MFLRFIEQEIECYQKEYGKDYIYLWKEVSGLYIFMPTVEILRFYLSWRLGQGTP